MFPLQIEKQACHILCRLTSSLFIRGSFFTRLREVSVSSRESHGGWQPSPDFRATGGQDGWVAGFWLPARSKLPSRSTSLSGQPNRPMTAGRVLNDVRDDGKAGRVEQTPVLLRIKATMVERIAL